MKKGTIYFITALCSLLFYSAQLGAASYALVGRVDTLAPSFSADTKQGKSSFAGGHAGKTVCGGKRPIGAFIGARYYDARTSVWQSADGAFDKYLPEDDNKSNLLGQGGIYNPLNLGVYGYGHLNPIKHTDPDGNYVVPLLLVIAFVMTVGVQSADESDKAYQKRMGVDIGPVDLLMMAAFGGRGPKAGPRIPTKAPTTTTPTLKTGPQSNVRSPVGSPFKKGGPPRDPKSGKKRLKKERSALNKKGLSQWLEIGGLFFLQFGLDLFKKPDGLQRVETFTAMSANIGMNTDGRKVVTTAKDLIHLFLHKLTTAHRTFFKRNHFFTLFLKSTHRSGSGI